MENTNTSFVSRALDKLGKLSPDQVRQLFEVASEERATQDAILASLPTGLIISDSAGKVTQKNKAAERFLSYSAEMRAFIESAQARGATNLFRDFTAASSNGGARFLTVTIMPLVRGSRVAGSITKIEDTTDKYKRDMLIHRMEHLTSLTNLAASVAHEIKNPLAGISIHIQLIQKALAKARASDGKLPDKKYAEDYLAVITEEIDRLNKTIVDFLFAVRPVKAGLAPFDADELVRKFADFSRTELAEKGIIFEEALWSDAVKGARTAIMLDEQLFRQVLVNLVKNAMEAFEEQDPSPADKRLLLKSAVKEDRYFLTIQDNGPGMSAETTGRIFEPYYTTKATGTGLGLTMVYKIVKEMLGEIDVTSTPGEGTAFVLSFPIPQGETKLLEAL